MSNLGAMLQRYQSERQQEDGYVPFAEAVALERIPLPFLEFQMLRSDTIVFEPLVVNLDESLVGVIGYSQLILLPPEMDQPGEGGSLQDCILVTPKSWAARGCRNYYLATTSRRKMRLRASGARALRKGCSSVQSSAPLVYEEAWKHARANYLGRDWVARRHLLIRGWMVHGWGGGEDEYGMVRWSLSRICYRQLRLLVMYKLRVLWEATSDLITSTSLWRGVRSRYWR